MINYEKKLFDKDGKFLQTIFISKNHHESVACCIICHHPIFVSLDIFYHTQARFVDAYYQSLRHWRHKHEIDLYIRERNDYIRRNNNGK